MSNFTPSAIATVLLSFVSVTLVGCFDTRQQIILNSDGRGKAIIESTFAQADLLSATENTLLRDRSANHYVRGLLEEAEGHWAEVVRAARPARQGGGVRGLDAASEALLETFEQLTARYERSMQVLMG